MSHPRKRRLPVLLVLLCLVWQTGCQAPSGDDFRNIVFITIDTLRADRLGTYGYFRDTSPVIDALANESIVFERCFATMATTFPSHLSLFTGTYPNETGAFANVGAGGQAFQPTDYLRSLPQLLRDGGYRTAAFISGAPLKRFSGLAAGFDVYSQPRGPSRRAEATNAEVFKWLETTGVGPFFLWVHYFDPHAPYGPPKPFVDEYRSEPEFIAYLEDRSFAPKRGVDARTKSVNNRYDGEVNYVDEQIGKLLDALRSREDDWKETIVVVVSDHGEGLRQHGQGWHGGVWNEQLHVALLMRIPGQKPARIDRLMSIADVVPTLMGLAELPGEDAFRRQASGTDRLSSESGGTLIFGQGSAAQWKVGSEGDRPRYLLIGEEWKYVYKPDGKASLFRLLSDPYELADVSKDHPEVVARLHPILMQRLEKQEERLAIHRATATTTEGEIDPAILEQLRSLGYIE